MEARKENNYLLDKDSDGYSEELTLGTYLSLSSNEEG